MFALSFCFCALLVGLLGGLRFFPHLILMGENAGKSDICLVKQLKIPAGLGVSGVQVGVQFSTPAVSLFYCCKVGVFLKIENGVAFLERYLAGAASHDLLEDKGVGFTTAVIGQQAILQQIVASDPGKIGVPGFRADAGAEFLTMERLAESSMLPRKRPRAAYGRFARKYAAALPLFEKDAVAVGTAAYLQLAANMVAVTLNNGFRSRPCGQPGRKVGGADHNTAAAFAAVAAHVAIENRIRCNRHEFILESWQRWAAGGRVPP